MYQVSLTTPSKLWSDIHMYTREVVEVVGVPGSSTQVNKFSNLVDYSHVYAQWALSLA